jgi:hypothetical protein
MGEEYFIPRGVLHGGEGKQGWGLTVDLTFLN